MRHELTDDATGELTATTEIVAVHIEMTARRARGLPSEVRERAMLMMKGEGGQNRSELQFRESRENLSVIREGRPRESRHPARHRTHRGASADHRVQGPQLLGVSHAGRVRICDWRWLGRWFCRLG
jgi:hypothetical protein